MKMAEKLLTVILFSLSFMASSLACSYPDDPGLAAAKKSCMSNEAKRWDCSLNRCINTVESMQTRDEYKECESLEASARKKCQQKLAESKTGKLEAGSPPHLLGAGISTLNLVLWGINLMSSKEGATGCTSRTIFGVTAAAGVAQELYFRFFASKKLKNIQKKYEKDELYQDPYEGQLNAFKYLKEEQEYISSHAKKRKMAYYLLTAGYGAATGFAIYEMTPAGYAGACKGGGTGKDAVDETETHKGEGTDGADAISLKLSMAKMFSKNFISYLSTSPGILTLSGISTAISLYLAQAAGKQAGEASENAEKVSAVMAKFEKTVANTCPKGRDDLSNPKCYCYTERGEKNEGHSNSQTCQSQWAKDDAYLFKKTQDKVAGSTPRQGCVDSNGAFDAGCRCRLFKDGKGNNACKKVPVIANIGGLNSAFSVPQVTSGLNETFNGNITGGDVTGSGNLRLAHNNLKARDELIKQIERQRKNDKKPPLNFNANREAKKFLTKAITPSLRKIASKNGGTIRSSAPQGKVAAALKQAQKKAGINNDLFYNKSKGPLLKKGKNKAKGFSFSYSPDNNTNKVEEFADAENENKNYDFKSNDIVTREDASIWKVLSHRYNTSGLRRLFEEEEVSE